ncbi:FtsX-like permease family protein [Candidatus Gracilibacteria bacterium 28_42_T64]|nr:FtsX-like permease family protein [Candidatus Gracilibacteria bacterium 28_42_T64]
MLFRIAKYSIKNIFRNKFLSFSSVLVLTLLMFFINILILLHDVSFKLISSINSKLTISLYLDEEYDKGSTEVIGLIEDIKKIGGKIKVEYKTKEVILEDIRLKEPDLAKILERTNPLPDTIILSQIQLEEYEEMNSFIENKLYILSKDESDIEHFSNYTTQYKKINQVIHVLDILSIGLYIIIITFLLSIFVITYSIIGNFIYYYKDEIYITRLVGGSKKFIYGPFVLQGSFYSFVSFLLSLIIFVFILQNINAAFSDIYFFDFSYNTFLIEMLVFVFVGGLSGFLSSRKYLK